MAIPAWQLLIDSRRTAGLTQAALAARLGTSQAAIARLERTGSNPTVTTLERTLAATGHRLELAASSGRSSIDETLIAENLRLTPAARLRAFQRSRDSVAGIAGRARRRGGRRR